MKMGKVYQSAMGKMVDFTALSAKNERVRAVGNMNVNARGDIIDSNNDVINDSSKRVNTFYSKTMNNIGAMSSQAVAPVAEQRQGDLVEDDISEVEKNLLQEFDEPNPVKEEVKKSKKK
jgi:hypothetical protein